MAITDVINTQLNRFPPYITGLPPCTKALVLITVLASLADALSLFDVQGWGALVPDKITFLSGESFHDEPIFSRWGGG